MKIAIIPEVISRHLKSFRRLMSKPQFAHFSAYCAGLIVSEEKSINQIAKSIPNRDQSSLNRFLTRGIWDKGAARKRALQMVKPSLGKHAVFIVDDTLAHKTGKKMEGAALHYDNLHKRKCFGHSIVTSGYATKGRFAPFRLAVYQRKGHLTQNTKFCTKNALAINILNEALSFHPFRYAVIDAWYTNKTVIGSLREQKQFFIGDLKCNRNITIGRVKKSVADHCFITKMKEYTINNQRYRAYVEDAYLPSIGKMKIVYCQMKHKNEWTGVKYLVTNMFHLTAMQCIAAYNARHAIEAFHRDGKQEVALETFHMRKYAGVVTHLTCVLISYLLLLLSKVVFGIRGTIGEICRNIRLQAEKHAIQAVMYCKARLKEKQRAVNFLCS